MGTSYKLVTRSRMSCRAADDATLVYKKRTIVRKLPGTIGIFVFESKKAAYDAFRSSLNCQTLMCLRVRPIGRGRRVKFINDWCALLASHVKWCSKYCEVAHLSHRAITRRRDINKDAVKFMSHEGTLVYDAVEVLD